MMMPKFVFLCAIAFGTLVAHIGNVWGQQLAKASLEQVEAYVRNTWKSPPAGWESRIKQDETQRVCSQFRNDPPRAEYAAIKAREIATLVFPADGNVLGSWKAGEAVAQTGTGGQFSDKDDTARGGNCYACHQMDPKEISFGTIGPGLVGYGQLRDFKPEATRDAFAKVFNAQAALACSTMPRFGHNKVLTEQQIQDVTAYLMSPDSPVNKP